MLNGQSEVPMPPDAMVVSLDRYPDVCGPAAFRTRRRVRRHCDDAAALLFPGAAKQSQLKKN